jgi:hypothetical protein
MKKTLAIFGMIALSLAACPFAATAQQTPPRVTSPSAVYVELLGNGLLYSINYDHRIAPKLAARVGVMGLGGVSDSSSAAVFTAPVMLSYLFGEGNSHFEVGAGLILAAGAVDEVDPLEDESFSRAFGTATLGYRYQRPDGGFIFRTGLTPFFDHTGFAPSFGISFGYGF